MASAINKTLRFFSRLNLWLAILGASILFFSATIIFIEVASRAMFGTSQLWVIEVSEYSLLFITFLGSPYLLEKNMHVTLDIVHENLPYRWRLAAQVLVAALGAVICIILTVIGIAVVLDQFATGVREASVMAPRSYWITAVLPFGMFLMAIQFVLHGIAAIRQKGF